MRSIQSLVLTLEVCLSDMCHGRDFQGQFLLRNEELEAEQEKVGKRQLERITDEFSMEVSLT